MRVLAIDPSLRGTGYAILETGTPANNGRNTALASGFRRPPVAAATLTTAPAAGLDVRGLARAGALTLALAATARVATAGTPRACGYGTIKNKSDLLPSSCLVRIRDRIAELIHEHEPDCCAVEGVIFVQSYKTAITLGAARGAAILAAAERGLPVYEYAPRLVKMSVVGRGGADKTQVAFMVRALLGLTETPAPDAADALAIGLTHLRTQESALLRAPLGLEGKARI